MSPTPTDPAASTPTPWTIDTIRQCLAEYDGALGHHRAAACERILTSVVSAVNQHAALVADRDVLRTALCDFKADLYRTAAQNTELLAEKAELVAFVTRAACLSVDNQTLARWEEEGDSDAQDIRQARALLARMRDGGA